MRNRRRVFEDGHEGPACIRKADIFEQADAPVRLDHRLNRSNHADLGEDRTIPTSLQAHLSGIGLSGLGQGDTVHPREPHLAASSAPPSVAINRWFTGICVQESSLPLGQAISRRSTVVVAPRPNVTARCDCER